MTCHSKVRPRVCALVLACVLVGLVLGSAYETRADPGPTLTVTPTALAWTDFADPNGLFSLRYPSNWAAAHGEIVVFSPAAQTSQGLAALPESPVLAILPDEQSVTAKMSPREAVRFWIQSLRGNWNEVQVAVQADRRVDGQVSAASRVSGIDERTQIAFEMYLAVFDLNGQNCLVIAIAPRSQWDASWPIMQQMLDTLTAPSRAAPATASEMGESTPVPWELELAQDGAARLNDPRAVGIGRNGQVYVLDAGADRVQVYDAQGNFLFAFGESGAKPGQFDFAEGGALAVDRSGQLYVLEPKNQRIQVFDPEGNLLRRIASGGLRSARDIAVSSGGQVYVSSEEARNIRAFDAEGHLTRHFVYKPKNGRVSSPRGLAVDSQDRLYVADPVAQSVFVLDAEGQPVTAVGSQSSEASHLAWPVAVTVGEGGQIYVGDTELRAVRVFSPEGQLLADQGPLRERGVVTPGCLAFDPAGRLYVCDVEGKRVVRYGLSGPTQAAPEQLPLVNGSFNGGLTGWREVPADMPSAGASVSVTVDVTDTGRLHGPALEIKRTTDGLSSGRAGVYQDLNLSAHGLKSLHLLAQVMIIKEEGENIGGPDSGQPPGAAIILKLTYRDKNGNNGEWYHGFYSKNVPGSDAVHFTTTPLEEWYQYKSDNLLAQTPDLAVITGLCTLYGFGQNMAGRVSGVQLVCSSWGVRHPEFWKGCTRGFESQGAILPVARSWTGIWPIRPPWRRCKAAMAISWLTRLKRNQKSSVKKATATTTTSIASTHASP